MSSPGNIMISVLVVRLVVDEVGLPKKLLFRVLELTDHIGGWLAVLLMGVLVLVGSKDISSKMISKSDSIGRVDAMNGSLHYRNLIAAAVMFWRLNFCCDKKSCPTLSRLPAPLLSAFLACKRLQFYPSFSFPPCQLSAATAPTVRGRPRQCAEKD